MENLSVNPENYKILVVDDIATNVLLLKTILGKAGYRIVTATGGREALEKVESESPDLILLDIMMPDMNGYEVIERLKADERFCRIPVIFLSALHDSENIVKGFKMGASDYVSKPFNHEELITRVAHHMFIAEAQRVIVRQNEELQETLASRDKMYSVIAHDLRSPIGSLKMLFNTLLDSLDAERVGAGNLDMLRMGNDIAEDTFSLLDNLLKWTKCQTGRMHTVYQDVDLAEVVLFSSKISESVARTKGIVVEYDIPAPIHVRCDVDMVKTIVRNLLSNAIKYSPEGGGKIIVSTAETPTHAVVRVRDFGVGIKPEDLNKVLDPAMYFTTYGTGKEEGSGLGLQLCLDLVHRNGGEMTVESVYGEGATFSFTIAKSPADERPASAGGAGLMFNLCFFASGSGSALFLLRAGCRWPNHSSNQFSGSSEALFAAVFSGVYVLLLALTVVAGFFPAFVPDVFGLRTDFRCPFRSSGAPKASCTEESWR